MSDIDLSAAVEAAATDLFRVAVVAGEGVADRETYRRDALTVLAAAAPAIEAQVRAQVAHLVPAESLALTIALAQIRRGEPVTPNIAAMCTITLSRLAKGDS